MNLKKIMGHKILNDKSIYFFKISQTKFPKDALFIYVTGR